MASSTALPAPQNDHRDHPDRHAILSRLLRELMVAQGRASLAYYHRLPLCRWRFGGDHQVLSTTSP